MAMDQPFSIHFKYPFKDRDFSIALTGNATLHQSKLYYIVSHIRFAKHPGGPLDALPEVKVQQRDLRGERVWVHMDTQKESELSRIIGEAIEHHLSQNPTNHVGQ